jgi:hypothetical protein
MKHLFLFVALFAFVFLLGCKSNTAPAPGPTIVIPNVGSSWTIRNVRLDSNNVVKKTDTSIRTVGAINMTIAPYNDVVMTYETNPVTGKNDTAYLRYLSNGDVAHLSSPAIDPALPEWLTVRFYTHVAQNFNYGGNISYLGFTHDTVSFSTSFVKSDNDTIGGVIYPASFVMTTTTQKATSATKDSTNFNTQTNSFIASKGIFGGRNVSMNQVNGKQVLRVQQTVLSVSLK